MSQPGPQMFGNGANPSKSSTDAGPFDQRLPLRKGETGRLWD